MTLGESPLGGPPIDLGDYTAPDGGAGVVPVGTVIAFAGVGTPSPGTWLRCDGTIYTTASAPALALALGNTYGGAPGITFGVPDLRGRVPVGAGGSLGALGATGGEFTHQLTLAETPSHTHATTVTFSTGAGATTTGNAQPPNNNAFANFAVGNVTGSAGSDGAHNNVQPYIALAYWIRAA